MAQPARRWSEADGDSSEEIDDPADGLVSRDDLDMRFADFEARLTWKTVDLPRARLVGSDLRLEELWATSRLSNKVNVR